MEDDELVDTIHKSFRVTYLRDTLLRPTMDENSLSTLSSLMTFTHADVVKGVTQGGDDSYLVKVLRMLATEISVITQMEWNQLQEQQSSGELLPTAAKENITTTTSSVHHQAPPSPAPSSISELSFRAESKKDETTTIHVVEATLGATGWVLGITVAS